MYLYLNNLNLFPLSEEANRNEDKKNKILVFSNSHISIIENKKKNKKRIKEEKKNLRNKFKKTRILREKAIILKKAKKTRRLSA